MDLNFVLFYKTRFGKNLWSSLPKFLEEDKSQLFHDMKAQKEQIMKAQNGFSEYFHFPASIVTSDDELFVPGITAEMLAIIRYELQTGPAGVSFNLFR